MTIKELIEQLEQLPEDTLVVSGTYDAYRGEYSELYEPTQIRNTIFVKPLPNGRFLDVTDREREQDLEALVL